MFNLKLKIMKKTILLIGAITVLTAFGYSQADPSSTKINKAYSENNYLIKYKKQKTAAWICLGGGVALCTIAALIATPKATEDYISLFTFQDTQHDYTTETILTVLGGAGIITSIPLFIASAKNKRKANLSLTSQKTVYGLPVATNKTITGISLSIPL